MAMAAIACQPHSASRERGLAPFLRAWAASRYPASR
ncbi:Uncharacterised protein [Mycobacteroides abscessus subsp. abscessus]|nr:Uncharacterised protein [Mycobacteroides abscessus subsp. abscessus]